MEALYKIEEVISMLVFFFFFLNQKWMLDFVKLFFCIYWDIIVFFFLVYI